MPCLSGISGIDDLNTALKVIENMVHYNLMKLVWINKMQYLHEIELHFYQFHVYLIDTCCVAACNLLYIQIMRT